MRLTEPVIAIVGSNEAGKTGLLKAIQHLNDERAFEPRDKTRRLDVKTQIMAIYELSDDDRSSLAKAGVAQAEKVYQCRLTKKDDGKFSIDLIGRTRDTASRTELANKLEAIIATPTIIDFGKTPDEKRDRIARLKAAAAVLRTTEEALSEGQNHQVKQAAGEISSILSQPSIPQNEKADAAQFANAIADLVKIEQEWQSTRAQPTIASRKPRAVMFDDQSRDLKPSYEVAKAAAEKPPALRNLAQVSQLNLEQLKKAVETSDLTLRTELLEKANEKARELFSQAWVQSDVVPQFAVEGGWLHLLVRTRDRGVSRFDERSDGLRWFIALVAFLTFQHHDGQQPILLVDEADTHLSYDAQAGLMEVLENQQVAQKVVYTTHSAGCLPSDLGTGIRAVQQLEGERSTVHNGFWKQGLGLSPIYLAMGLTPLAFTTARNELIGEGPCECILLPTLVREALGLRRLAYQVAPGGAGVEASQLGDLISECGRALFVVDGDAGGAAIRQKLTSAGIAPGKIASYADYGGTDFHLEDLVSPGAYCKAFNAELERWQKGTGRITEADVPGPQRLDQAMEWCSRNHYSSPSKVTVSQTLAENAAMGDEIVNPAAVSILRSLHTWATQHFGVTSPAVKRA